MCREIYQEEELVKSLRAMVVKSFRDDLQSRFPKLYNSVSTYRNERRLRRISRKLIARYGAFVLSGPFAGMAYVPRATGSALAPKLLGCYEAELHGFLNRIFDAEYTEIVDIGCAEGYYAIGLALRLPNTRVYAFDTDPSARQLCKNMSQVNGVASRVFIERICDIERLRTLPLERSLVVCDCEGYELELLRPDLVPKLCTCDLLVELHDFVNPIISDTLLSRFVDTHDIELVKLTKREPTIYPELSIFKAEDQRLAVAEFRPEVMQWAFMTSKVKSNA